METMPSSVIASSKSALLCGDVFDLNAIEDIIQEIDYAQSEHPYESKRRIFQYLLDTAKPYRELEMLEKALYSMDEFATQVEVFES